MPMNDIFEFLYICSLCLQKYHTAKNIILGLIFDIGSVVTRLYKFHEIRVYFTIRMSTLNDQLCQSAHFKYTG